MSLLDIAYTGSNINGQDVKALFYERIEMELDRKSGKNTREVEKYFDDVPELGSVPRKTGNDDNDDDGSENEEQEESSEGNKKPAAKRRRKNPRHRWAN